jgi:hypothetical protein
VLLTQFSYACWVGNAADVAARRSAAHRKVDQLREQIRCFRPEFVVPFASFVWFCHEDNVHMNDSVNHVGPVAKAISDAGARPVVLYPGDRWVLGDDLASGSAIERYEADWSARTSAPRLTQPSPVVWSELAKAADEFRHRGLERNWRWRLRRFAPFTAYLKDLNATVAFSYRDGLSESSVPPQAADVSMGSGWLKFAFESDWGFDTLVVSGCFEKPAGGHFSRLEQYQWVASLNNQGRRLSDPFRRLAQRLAGADGST